MHQIAIVTDSTAYLPPEVQNRYDVKIVPLSVIFGNESYKEGVHIQNETFYKMLKENDTLPTTSQPSVGDFVSVYEQLSESYERAVSIHLSSGISGTCNAANQAAQMVEDFPVAVFDSEISMAPQALLVEEAGRMAAEGVAHERILERLTELRAKNRAYFVVDDLSHLHRSGRLNAAQLVIGSMLRIKPVLHFEDKRIVPFEKIRTKKKAKARITQLLTEDIKSLQAQGTEQPISFPVTIVHANVPEEAQKWKAELEEAYPELTIRLDTFGPVIATHVGEGTLGLTWNTAQGKG